MIIPQFLSTSGDMRADRRYEYARALADSNEMEAAIDLLLQTMEITPAWPVIPFQLGKYYKILGDHKQAIFYFEDTIKLDPDDRQGAALELERLGISAIEENMPPAFVETLFDQYAERFDEHLVETLDYQVPEMIGNLVRKFGSGGAYDRVLDLGCGTGLAGEHIKGSYHYLEGVDLSGGMLIKAEEKGIYDKLVQGEIVEYLQKSSGQYNLIIAADVISYFGALDNLLQEVAKALLGEGYFIFSVQALREPPPDPDQPDYYLGKARRFSHGQNYLQEVIASSGMQTQLFERAVLRKDEGEDVNGYLIVTSLKR